MSGRGTHFALLCLGLFLFSFAVSVGKPGLPATLKADEPAYFLMAMSLWEDGDLRSETEDFERIFETYPYRHVDNLILMSDDGFETVYFGKPYIYSLLAAPLAALAGANGLVALNMLFLVAMLWMGMVYLGRFNSPGLSLGFSLAFFFLSPTFAYAFWLQPELLNMASVTAGLFFAFHDFSTPPATGGRWSTIRRRLLNPSTAPIWSAGLLSFAVYNKPNLALIGLPILFYLYRRKGWRPALVWCVAALVVGGAIALGAVALTGHPTAYLGAARAGVRVLDPQAMDEVFAAMPGRLGGLSTTANSWSWMFDSPPIDWAQFREDAGYFFWGRHTGFLVYTPLALLALLYLVLHRRRSTTRWLLVAAAFVYGFFFILKIPHNWHGGSGFIGNRYFIAVYPVFLFLVTRVRPVWPLPAASVAGGLFLGSLLLTPFGAPVPKPTLQAHVRSLPFRFFPLELSIRQAIPGYSVLSYWGVTFVGREDQLKNHQPADAVMWVPGASRTQVEVLTEDPLDSLFFEVRTWAPDNRVVLDLAGHRETVEFVDVKGEKRDRVVEIVPGGRGRLTHDHRNTFHAYRLAIDIEHGRRIVDAVDRSQVFFVGAQLRYLGRREQIARPEHYRLEWLGAEVPETVTAATLFEVPVRIRSGCELPIASTGPLPVLLGYHWTDAAGESVVFDGRRSPLPAEVAPGSEIDAVVKVRSPGRPGVYRLTLDAVREPVAWFSERGGETMTLEVQVEPATTGG